MNKVKLFLIRLYRSTALRIWLIGTLIYSTFSVCPFCGKNACPGNFAAAALVGSVFAFGKSVLNKTKCLFIYLFNRKRKEMT